MAKINRTDVIQKAVSDLGINPTTSVIPTDTLDKVQLTYGLNKTFFINVIDDNTITATQSAATQYTTHATKETYLMGYSFNNVSDVTADNTTLLFSVKVFPSTASSTIMRINKPTTTVFNIEKTVMFPNPVRLTPGTTVLFTNAFTVGASVSGLTLFFTEVEPY